MIKLHLQTVTVMAVLLRKTAGVVALCPDARVVKSFPDNHDGTGAVLLLQRGVQKSLPVVDQNVDGVEAGLVKKPRFVSGCGERRRRPQRLAIHKN